MTESKNVGPECVGPDPFSKLGLWQTLLTELQLFAKLFLAQGAVQRVNKDTGHYLVIVKDQYSHLVYPNLVI